MSMNKLFITLIGLFGYYSFLTAQKYEIHVKIEGYTNDTLLLGYQYGDKQYIKDTALIKKGEFVFTGDTALEAGMYLIVLQPTHDYFQILVDSDKQKFNISSDVKTLNESLKFKGSKLNDEFYDYINYIGIQKNKADSLGDLSKLEKDPKEKAKLEQALTKIDQAVKDKQESIINRKDKSLLGLLINWSKDVEIPKYEGTADEINEKSFLFYKTHFFDGGDFLDDRSLRLPLFASKVNRYLDKLTIQVPDSINAALDFILSKCKEGSEIYKYVLSNSLNTYANSKYVGMDGVYVHLVEKYYAQGKAPWIQEEPLAKMVQDAKALKPLLIDKIAPNIMVYKQDSTPISLHDIKSEYTLLLIWAPDCGHCKESMPAIKKFYNEYKSKGVEIFALCSKTGDVKACWDGVETLGMKDWINTTDPEHKSRFRIIYDVKTTPQVYILDKDKRILTKKIGAEQLPEVMEKLFRIKANETKEK